MPASSATRTVATLEARDLVLGAAPLVAGTIVGAATAGEGKGWYRTLAKPSWTPPGAAFGPVWSLLYVLMGVASVIVARAGRERMGTGASFVRRRAGLALGLHAVQLALNLAWSVIFFGRRELKPAGVELAVLWGSVVATVVAFWRVRMLAGVLLVPYLAWTSFAGLLNTELIRRNPHR
jgi:translocator protein